MAHEPFLAMIQPLTGEPPTSPGGGGGQPSHPWVPPGGEPSHPWVPPMPTPIPPEPVDPLPPGYKYAYAYSPQWRMWGWGAFKVGDQGGGGAEGGQPSHPWVPPAQPKR
jgi:hypothetical protein